MNSRIMTKTERNQAFVSLILIFADLLKFPNNALYQELISGDLDNEINRQSIAAGVSKRKHLLMRTWSGSITIASWGLGSLSRLS
jgi:hypothetical protein